MFSTEPEQVAILGVNSDENVADAQFVVDTLALNYETLKNDLALGTISAKYKIHMWPTFVVIDAKGNVRHFHSGYSPTLRDDVGAMIQDLLAESGE